MVTTWRGALLSQTHLLSQAAPEEPGHLLHQLVSNGQQVALGLFEALPVQIRSTRPVDKTGRDAHPVAELFHAALDETAHVQRAGDAIAGY